MQTLHFSYRAASRLPGERTQALVGVVASNDLEVLLQRTSQSTDCVVTVSTAVHGFDAVWKAVLDDFVERRAPGGLHIAINDGGARPDVVALRLAQGVRLMGDGA
jgi:malonate decarboxylase acyl carrier protein